MVNVKPNCSYIVHLPSGQISVGGWSISLGAIRVMKSSASGLKVLCGEGFGNEVLDEFDEDSAR